MKTAAFILIFVATSALGADTNVDNIMPPPLPPSPVQEFRQWLKLPRNERMAAMAKRSPETQKVLAKKLDEYEQMSQEERNRKLAGVELQWYVRTLVNVTPEQRAKTLEVIPVKWKPAVQERLSKWDQAPANLREEILNNKANLIYVSSPQAGPQPPLPVAQTELRTFFKLPPDRLMKAFSNFPPEERAQMIETLRVFRALPEAQRQECVQAFSKFSAMAKPEQDAFLENVNRWQSMSQQDRETWRQIVEAFPPMPPMPPGFGEPPMPRMEP